jgi:uncharacterized coiled-coil protein SlyX
VRDDGNESYIDFALTGETTAETDAIARQQKQIDALTAGLQKVSAQIEASKPAPQLVNNP